MRAKDPFFQRYSLNRNSGPKWKRWLGAILGLVAFGILIYNVPFVHSRLAWRLEELKTRLFYFFNPPEEAVFVPQTQGNFAATASALALTPHPSRTPLPVTPQPTSLPLPASVSLTGFKYIDQHGGWNLCGPATLAMALTYWGWSGTRNDVEDYVKPGLADPNLSRLDRGYPDKNVMPYELEDFVDSQVPGLQAAWRVGGDLDLIKRFMAAGFPVIVEKASECDTGGKITWCGHYLFVTGYDDAKQEFIIQDVYLRIGAGLQGRNVSSVSSQDLFTKYWDEKASGKDLKESYDDFLTQWRAFDYLFFVIYPEDRRDEVINLFGPWNDDAWANGHALEIAQTESKTLTGLDQYFAWFNVGTSHVKLQEYIDAAIAYDKAFDLYAALPNDGSIKLPFRMQWYQTGPYWAYFYSGRYNEVVELANKTLSTLMEPTLEESLYWRGLAYWALGETDNAIADLQETVRINPHFCPGWQQISALGISPPATPWMGCSG